MTREIDHERLVTYFASDEAKHVTAQVVSVDGAQSLYHPWRRCAWIKSPEETLSGCHQVGAAHTNRGARRS
jgi:hypothetical protein